MEYRTKTRPLTASSNEETFLQASASDFRRNVSSMFSLYSIYSDNALKRVKHLKTGDISTIFSQNSEASA